MQAWGKDGRDVVSEYSALLAPHFGCLNRIARRSTEMQKSLSDARTVFIAEQEAETPAGLVTLRDLRVQELRVAVQDEWARVLHADLDASKEEAGRRAEEQPDSFPAAAAAWRRSIARGRRMLDVSVLQEAVPACVDKQDMTALRDLCREHGLSDDYLAAHEGAAEDVVARARTEVERRRAANSEILRRFLAEHDAGRASP